MIDMKQKDKDLQVIQSKLKEIVNSIQTVQGLVHQVAVMASIYAYKYNDADAISTVLNNLTGVRGSFRVESVAYWFKHIAGLNPTFTEKTDRWATKFNKNGDYISDQGVTFTFDKVHVAVLKQDKYKFWVIAPKQNMNLKLPTDLEIVTKSAEIQLARAIAAGSITDAAIKLHIAKMFDRIQALAETGKTKEWLEEFYLQHPDQKPVAEMDAFETELAELESAELAELEVSNQE